MSHVRALSPSAFTPPPSPESAQCSHCGLPIPKGLVGAFCCKGCAQVHAMLHALNLTHYYALRANDIDSERAPARVSQDRFDFFNDPGFYCQFVIRDESSSRAHVSLQLEGVHCVACVWLLERLPEILPGVLESKLDFSASRLQVTLDLSRASLPELARTINSLGYIPHPYLPDEFAAIRKQERRKLLTQLGVAGVCAGNTMLLAVSLYQGAFSGFDQHLRVFFEWASALVALPSVAYSARPFYNSAYAAIRHRSLHLDIPITLGVLGGYVLSIVSLLLGGSDVYFDSVCMLVFLLLVGRYLQRASLDRAYEQSMTLGALSYEGVIRIDPVLGSFEEVHHSSVRSGDRLRIVAGNRFPCDGVVRNGISSVDNAILTGESALLSVSSGSAVYGGALNCTADIEIEATSSAGEARFSKLLRSARQQEGSSSERERLPFASLRSKFVLILLLLALVNGALWAIFSGIPQAISTTLALIVIACPCALGLAMPLAIARFQSCAAFRGIFLRRPDAIARCESINEVIFDKTGTLTRGSPVISRVLPGNRIPEQQRSEALAALLKLQLGSVHPAAIAIANWCKAQEIEPSRELEATPLVDGSGVEGTDGMHSYRVGGFQVLASRGLDAEGRAMTEGFDESLSASFFVRDSEILYAFGLRDEPVPSLDALLAQFSEHVSMSLLSGDRSAVTRAFGKRFGFLDERVIAEANPEQKKRYVETLLATSGGVLFVGDGANDAPAMTAATLSYGLHGGAEACLSSSDAYISTGSLRDAWELFKRSKQALRFMRGLLYFSVSYNVVGALLAVSGVASPLVAAIFMPVSSFTVIAATRCWFPFGRSVLVRW